MDFFRKHGKVSKKVKNDEKGSDIDEKGQNWWKMKKIIFSDFFRKDGKVSIKVKKDEKGSDIDEKGQNWWKMKKNNIFWTFSEKYGRCGKKWKMKKKGQILMKKVKIDEKWKQ